MPLLLSPRVKRFLFLFLSFYLARLVWRRLRGPRPRRNVAAFVNSEMNPLLTVSGSALAAGIRHGKLTSVQVVSLFVEQIRKVNPLLNSMVVPRLEKALVQAAEADKLTAEYAQKGRLADLPPFHGVPITIKECFQTVGEPWSAGVVTRAKLLGTQDATVVTRLEQAGMIILGKGNVSENCMWMESNNKVYGRTNNPYDLDRTVGGSSGGEASLVSACGSPCCIASDVGGSIRIPAFFNGLFGHKPTGGCVPNTRTWPPCTNEVQRYCQLGPISRHAEDLMPLLRAIAGPDGEDALTLSYELGDPHTVDITKIPILYCPDAGANRLVSRRCPELLDAQHKVVAALIARGCQVRTVAIPEMHEAFEIWSAMMSAANSTKFRILTSVGKEQIWVGWELAKAVFGYSDHTIPALGLAALERLPELMPARSKYVRQLGAKLQDRLHDLLGENGVMLYPTLPQPAPFHNDLILRFFDASFTSVFNVMELPVTAVPLGLNNQGLPMGIQVVANRYQDHIGIAFALALEQIFHGWQPPLKF